MGIITHRLEVEDEQISSDVYRGFIVEVWRNANERTFFSLTFNTAVKNPSSAPSADFPDAEGALRAGREKVDRRLTRRALADSLSGEGEK